MKKEKIKKTSIWKAYEGSEEFPFEVYLVDREDGFIYSPYIGICTLSLIGIDKVKKNKKEK